MEKKSETVWFRSFSVRLIVFRSQHLHPLRAAQHIQILTRPTIASHALSGSAFLDSTDGANLQNQLLPIMSLHILIVSTSFSIIMY